MNRELFIGFLLLVLAAVLVSYGRGLVLRRHLRTVRDRTFSLVVDPVYQHAVGAQVNQAGRDLHVVSSMPASVTRQPIPIEVWQRLQREHLAGGDDCTYVDEHNLMMSRLEGWHEITVAGPGGSLDRLIILDRGQVLGVPVFRALPWKGLSVTARRMLGRLVKGKGSLDHFRANWLDVVRVHMGQLSYGFWDYAGANALEELLNRPNPFLTNTGGPAYSLTADGLRAGEALLRVHGDAWLDEPNPDCEERRLS